MNDQLNPKLFENNKLKGEVRDKLVEIADAFVENLEENKIPLNVLDYWLVGSNASYNYSDSSDIDVHIIVDFSTVNVSHDILSILYNYARNSFNKTYDINVKGMPVELYVEGENSTVVSNGVYSIKKNRWVKEPVKYEVKSIDITSTPLYKKWKEMSEDVRDNDVEYLLNALYLLRKESILREGEYGVGNLLFKQLRREGYVDLLRDKIHEIRSRELSLEGLKESREDKERFVIKGRLFSVPFDLGKPRFEGFHQSEGVYTLNEAQHGDAADYIIFKKISNNGFFHQEFDNIVNKEVSYAAPYSIEHEKDFTAATLGRNGLDVYDLEHNDGEDSHWNYAVRYLIKAIEDFYKG